MEPNVNLELSNRLTRDTDIAPSLPGTCSQLEIVGEYLHFAKHISVPYCICSTILTLKQPIMPCNSPRNHMEQALHVFENDWAARASGCHEHTVQDVPLRARLF